MCVRQTDSHRAKGDVVAPYELCFRGRGTRHVRGPLEEEVAGICGIVRREGSDKDRFARVEVGWTADELRET